MENLVPNIRMTQEHLTEMTAVLMAAASAAVPTGAASAAVPMAAAAEAGAAAPDSESIDITVLRCCDGS